MWIKHIFGSKIILISKVFRPTMFWHFFYQHLFLKKFFFDQYWIWNIYQRKKKNPTNHCLTRIQLLSSSLSQCSASLIFIFFNMLTQLIGQQKGIIWPTIFSDSKSFWAESYNKTRWYEERLFPSLFPLFFPLLSCHREKFPITGGNFLLQEKISSDRKKYPVTGRPFLLRDDISYHRTKCLVKGIDFLSQKDISCHKNKIPETGRNFITKDKRGAATGWFLMACAHEFLFYEYAVKLFVPSLLLLPRNPNFKDF